MTIGDNLRALRADSGMTQEQVAEQLGVTRQTLSSYESGRTRPDIDMLVRLCQVYDTDLDGIVHGQARVLKDLRRVRRTAVALLALLVGLTLLSSGLLWSANRFFPVSQGLLTQDGMAVFQQHRRLTEAWETADGIILAVSPAGFLVLLVLTAAGRRRIPVRQKLLYMAALAAGLLLAALPFAVTDPVFPEINYLLTPLHVIARMLLFFAVSLVMELVRRRTAAPEKR